MNIADVKKMKSLDRFLYWITERYQIYLRRRRNQPKPWTNDEILQRYFFTMPYRELDKTTLWFKEHIREPLRDDPAVLMATVIFRWFNLIATGEVLLGQGSWWESRGRPHPTRMPLRNMITDWSHEQVLEHLGYYRAQGHQVFTGAYMINSPGGRPKLEAICDRIENVWKQRKELLAGFVNEANQQPVPVTLQKAHEWLTEYDGLGGFMAYEIVCDLRYTYLLKHANDTLIWCNPGPGCIRGLYRVAGEDYPNKGNNATSPPKPKDWLERMQELLRTCWSRLGPMPRFEMREVEHSLCEFDKYERLLWGDGRAKRTFDGVH